METKGAVLQNGMLANVCTKVLRKKFYRGGALKLLTLMYAFSEQVDGYFKFSCYTLKQVQTH